MERLWRWISIERLWRSQKFFREEQSQVGIVRAVREGVLHALARRRLGRTEDETGWRDFVG